MISTFLSIIESQAERIFRNCNHYELQEVINLKKKDFEEMKKTFKEEERKRVNELLRLHSDYIHDVEWEEKDNCVILALKIGIELGRYFEILEDL